MAQGILHTYHPTRGLLLFEHEHPTLSPSSTVAAPSNNTNILLFVGGMFDNFLSPAYTLSLASLFRHSSSRWRIAHIQLSSAMRGFGISSLVKDVQELNTGVGWVREHLLGGHEEGKIVLMGHSTGCQDLLSYLYLSTPATGPLASRNKVDGVILQAPVSDREGSGAARDSSPEQRGKWDKCVELAKQTPEKEKRTTILPMHLSSGLFGPVPLSVERFESLASVGSPDEPGLDDLFSSDGSEELHRRTWGVVGREGGVLRGLSKNKGRREVLVLMSGSDEHVPEGVDMEGLMARWRKAIEDGRGALHEGSQVVVGGVHDLSGEEASGFNAREVLMRRAVVKYLADVLGEEVEESVEEELKRAEREVERLRKLEGDGERESKI